MYHEKLHKHIKDLQIINTLHFKFEYGVSFKVLFVMCCMSVLTGKILKLIGSISFLLLIDLLYFSKGVKLEGLGSLG
jgi:hypothetical protein